MANGRLFPAALLAVVVALQACSAAPVVPAASKASAVPTLPTGTLNITKSTNQCIEVQNNTTPATTPLDAVTGAAAAIVPALLANGTQPWLQTCNASLPTQQWTVVPANVTGYSALKSADSMCLDVPAGDAANGKLVQVWSCDYANPNQFWSVQNGALQWYNSTFCLNAQNGTANSFANNTALQLWSCDDGGVNNLISVPVLPTAVSNAASSDDGDDDSDVGTPATSGPVTKPYRTSGGKYNITSVFDPSRKRMLAWGYDGSAAPLMGYGAKIGSYHHWQDNEIEDMPSRVQYVPTYWGVTKTAQWILAKAQLGGTVPGAVMGFNEPDVPSQANMDPITAARLFKSQISDVYGARGSNVISPSIAYNVNGWLAPFMKECDRLGCDIDAIGLHIYLSLNQAGSVDNAVSIIKQRVESVSAKFGGRPVVLGELGLTQAGGGSDAQLLEFMQKSAAYLDHSPTVLAWALSAVFRRGQGWDGYLNSNLAFFDGSGGLTTLGKQYMNTAF